MHTNCFFVFVLTFRTIFAHNMFSPCSELVVFMYWTGKSMNNLLSYCGLVDPRISACDKDLPVSTAIVGLKIGVNNHNKYYYLRMGFLSDTTLILMHVFSVAKILYFSKNVCHLHTLFEEGQSKIKDQLIWLAAHFNKQSFLLICLPILFVF